MSTLEREEVDRPVGGAIDLRASALRAAYGSGALTPLDVVDAVLDLIEARGDDAVWIHRVDRDAVRAAALELADRPAAGDLPLYGLPFAVKDNIAVASVPTTAGCPAFGVVAQQHAAVVERLLDAGALLVGTTNLDQFATGLSGARSPYGTPVCPDDPTRVSGGSSSGSAVAVAAGLVTFAIGTDTAGSGRVPASFTGTVGLKPTPGRVSTRGLVPACASLDCPSVFALDVADAAAVLAVLDGFDPEDPWSRRLLPTSATITSRSLAGVRVGVPGPGELAFEDDDAAAAWQVALATLDAASAVAVPVDTAPFTAAGDLLYSGPWVAERWAGVGDFVSAHPDEVHPVVAEVLRGGAAVSGADAFRGQHALAALRRQSETVWDAVDVLLLPTTPCHPTVAAMGADPIGLNSVLGRWTTFANLLDLAVVAVPSVRTAAGLPVGVQLIGPTGSEDRLLGIAASWERARQREEPDQDRALLTVVGAHLSGQPLNALLTALGGSLHATTPTAAVYRFLALAGGPPHRPGLVRAESGGVSVEAETWSLPRGALGDVLVTVAPPLAIGTVDLADGTSTLGFVCEPAGAAGAVDISEAGGWRAHLAAG